VQTLYTICRGQVEAIAGLPADAFRHVVRSLSEGINSLDNSIADTASHALDQLASAFVRNCKRDTPLGGALARQLQASPSIFTALMKILFHIVMFSEHGNKTAIVRPLLPVILAAEIVEPGVSRLVMRPAGGDGTKQRGFHVSRAHARSPALRHHYPTPPSSLPPSPQVLERFCMEIVVKQPIHKHQLDMERQFKMLSEDIVASLEPTNRERFVTRMAVFISEVRSFATEVVFDEL
jgi:hypothetical protein